LTASKFIAVYAKLLRPGGMLHLKTDNAPLFGWSLDNFAKAGWQTEFISRNLHNEKSEENYHREAPIISEAQIMTTYEEKFAREGWPIYFACFTIKR